LESSDPSVLQILDDHTVYGAAPGSAQLTARDLETGIASAPVTITVKGKLASITLDPPTATRGIGEWESFTGIGRYEGAATEYLTQRLVYTTSDPSVAVADDLRPMVSRVRTVGAGTATITATDPLSGFTATAVVTVLPGTIERVTIEPATIVRNIG